MKGEIIALKLLYKEESVLNRIDATTRATNKQERLYIMTRRISSAWKKTAQNVKGRNRIQNRSAETVWSLSSGRAEHLCERSIHVTRETQLKKKKKTRKEQQEPTSCCYRFRTWNANEVFSWPKCRAADESATEWTDCTRILAMVKDDLASSARIKARQSDGQPSRSRLEIGTD